MTSPRQLHLEQRMVNTYLTNATRIALRHLERADQVLGHVKMAQVLQRDGMLTDAELAAKLDVHKELRR